MLELLSFAAASIALLAIAGVAFMRPYGALWRGALGAGLSLLGAGVAWRMTTQPAFTADTAVLVQWGAAFVSGIAIGAVVIAAAMLRHWLNGLGARALRG
ncbi:MAG TPA: hypothetical protein PKY87_03905 [Terricaulis sp.]|nr:hypothetical protein [Terricaulis sp.]